ncbi:Uncharacterised protein [Vibrio cholerae]|nr:Uncharacterised protein [Vibrio cholerae]
MISFFIAGRTSTKMTMMITKALANQRTQSLKFGCSQIGTSTICSISGSANGMLRTFSKSPRFSL